MKREKKNGCHYKHTTWTAPQPITGRPAYPEELLKFLPVRTEPANPPCRACFRGRRSRINLLDNLGSVLCASACFPRREPRVFLLKAPFHAVS
jgi:hypothetical protein